MDWSKYTPRSISVRVVIIMIGVVITAFGATLYILANLGADPVTAFVQGLAKQLKLSIGMGMNIFNIFFFIIIVLFGRKFIGIGTVLYTFTLGIFIDLFIKLLSPVFAGTDNLVLRIAALIIGTLTLALGLGFYQSAQFGAGPSDAFNQLAAEKTKIPLKFERIIFDVIMVLGGFIMGGVVHVGTLVGMFAVGPIMAPTMMKLGPLVDQWAGTTPKQSAT